MRRRTPTDGTEDRLMCDYDVSLTQALADPLVRAAMDADGVDPRKLEAELYAMAAALNLFDRSTVTAKGPVASRN
jgi:hypothetical protein